MPSEKKMVEILNKKIKQSMSWDSNPGALPLAPLARPKDFVNRYLLVSLLVSILEISVQLQNTYILSKLFAKLLKSPWKMIFFKIFCKFEN